jgi:DNA-directed RNA polymerase subunit RPC12/RpoP
MVTITLHCPHCGSDALVRDGHAPNGKQKYRCHSCGRRSRENLTPNAYPQARREEILHAYQERSSLRGLTRPLASLAPPCPVGSKKSDSASAFTDHLGSPLPRRCGFHHPGTR